MRESTFTGHCANSVEAVSNIDAMDRGKTLFISGLFRLKNGINLRNSSVWNQSPDESIN